MSAGLTRAQLLARSLTAAVAASGLLVARASADIRDDLDLVNYLLSVEYVQAALYRDALQDVTDLSEDVERLARELRDHEIAHVDGLRATITDAGGQPDERPRIAFGDQLRTEARFLKLANTLEDTAVSAYNGALPQLESKELVAALASIAQVEARHSALIRDARDVPPAPLAFDKDSSRQDVRTSIRPFERS